MHQKPKSSYILAKILLLPSPEKLYYSLIYLLLEWVDRIVNYQETLVQIPLGTCFNLDDIFVRLSSDNLITYCLTEYFARDLGSNIGRYLLQTGLGYWTHESRMGSSPWPSWYARSHGQFHEGEPLYLRTYIHRLSHQWPEVWHLLAHQFHVFSDNLTGNVISRTCLCSYSRYLILHCFLFSILLPHNLCFNL